MGVRASKLASKNTAIPVIFNAKAFGYEFICPNCNNKIIITNMHIYDKNKLLNKEIVSFKCFICGQTTDIKLKKK